MWHTKRLSKNILVTITNWSISQSGLLNKNWLCTSYLYSYENIQLYSSIKLFLILILSFTNFRLVVTLNCLVEIQPQALLAKTNVQIWSPKEIVARRTFGSPQTQLLPLVNVRKTGETVTHWDGDTGSTCEASASVKATVHHHCWPGRVYRPHLIVGHGHVLTHWPNRHVRLHGHVHLSTGVGRGHLRQLARHLRWKHISGLVYLQAGRERKRERKSEREKRGRGERL